MYANVPVSSFVSKSLRWKLHCFRVFYIFFFQPLRLELGSVQGLSFPVRSKVDRGASKARFQGLRMAQPTLKWIAPQHLRRSERREPDGGAVDSNEPKLFGTHGGTPVVHLSKRNLPKWALEKRWCCHVLLKKGACAEKPVVWIVGPVEWDFRVAAMISGYLDKTI